MNETSGTSPHTAQAPDYSSPRSMRLTTGGGSNIPFVKTFPEIRGGTCEYCGTLDYKQPGNMQYKFCPHYRGMDMQCIFCPPSKDQEEVVRNSVLKVMENPNRPGELVSYCQSFPCIQKLEEMFPFLKNR